MLTEEKVQDIEAQIQLSTHKSLRLLAQEPGVLLGSVFTLTGLIIDFACIK